MNENMPNRQLRTPMEMLIDSIRATEHDMKRTLHLIRGDAKRVDDEASALTARVKELEEALAKYADKENWGYYDESGCDKGHGRYTEACFIGPEIAQTALNKEPT